MAIAGHLGVLTIATGASATYIVIDGIGDIQLTDGREMLDITDFKDADIRRRIAGLRDASMTFNGDVEIADSGYLALRTSYEQSATCFIRMLHDGTNGLMFPMVIESIERSAKVDGKVEVSIKLQSEGSFAPVTVGSGM